MRILHVSWEYPPLIYGGLGRHVHALAESQSAAGHHVTVLTQRPPDSAAIEAVNGVHVVRIAAQTPDVPRAPEALLAWARDLDQRLARALPGLVEAARPAVVHAHDWVVAATAAAASDHELPVVTTVHATEAGRHLGWVHSPLSQTIHEIEFELAHRSDRVIVCSKAMQQEVVQLFDLPTNRTCVVPNGIDLTKWSAAESGSARTRINVTYPSIRESTPLILFTGRVEWEKGVHVLLEAVRLLALAGRFYPTIVAGTGTREEALKDEFSDLVDDGLATFAGWVSEEHLRDLVGAADVVVVPSIYEPFGLVALETAAVGTPLIVSEVGGLADIVHDRHTGLTVPAEDPVALSEAIHEVVADPLNARERAARLRESLHPKYDWRQIAKQTIECYRDACTYRPGSCREPLPDTPKPTQDNLFKKA